MPAHAAITAFVRPKGQMTLPPEIRDEAGITEGTQIEFIRTDRGWLLRPVVTVPADQAWFWDPQWQQGEQAANADIAAGRTTSFGSDDDFLESLT